MVFTIIAQSSFEEADQASFFGFIGIAAALVFASKFSFKFT